LRSVSLARRVGRTYSEQRFSPLNQIDEHNVGRLGLAWYYGTTGTS
jgi:glucose dehydrogenase